MSGDANKFVETFFHLPVNITIPTSFGQRFCMHYTYEAHLEVTCPICYKQIGIYNPIDTIIIVVLQNDVLYISVTPLILCTCVSFQVQTGFGRLGSHFWGFETEGLIPDIGMLASSIRTLSPAFRRLSLIFRLSTTACVFEGNVFSDSVINNKLTVLHDRTSTYYNYYACAISF